MALTGLLGIIIILLLAWLLSENRRAISPRTVAGALFIQTGIGGLVLFVPAGARFLEALTVRVQGVINYANSGIDFVFGGLASDRMYEIFGGGGFVFAFRVLPIIIFFSSLMSVLYYLGIMQWVVRVIGGALSRLLGTSRPESMAATANIFIGQTEAPLAVKPFLSNMTRSEMFAVMTGGLASIAGSVMAGYANMGVELKYLLAASFMSAPGGLLMAKMLIPETGQPREETSELDEAGFDAGEAEGEEGDPVNLVDAAARGAASGLHLALNVGAMLLAFIGLIALANGIIGGIGAWFGHGTLSLQYLLGHLFAPLAWVLGVPAVDIYQAGSLIGQKIVLNEFVAYAQYHGLKDSLQPLSQVIITFALCGFANLASVAILLGGLGTLAPSRRSLIASLGWRAVLAGSLSNFMSAALAGVFFSLTA
jgi:CNT family concentrative nucleoside transporter